MVDRKMGPRETKLREHLNSIPGIDTNTLLSNSHGWRADMREARLADALEETLAEWSMTVDMIETQDMWPETIKADRGRIVRMRAVLAEVDRG